MENYFGAFTSRIADVDALLAATPRRTTAAAHLGGVAVECRLKALLLAYHELSEWEQPSRRPRAPKLGQPISRPGHGLLAALRDMSAIYLKAKADRLFLSHLERVMHPTGATYADFIDLRYSADELDGTSMTDWRTSLDYVLRWLKKNEELL